MIIHRCKLLLFIIGLAPVPKGKQYKKLAKKAVNMSCGFLKIIFIF